MSNHETAPPNRPAAASTAAIGDAANEPTAELQRPTLSARSAPTEHEVGASALLQPNLQPNLQATLQATLKAKLQVSQTAVAGRVVAVGGGVIRARVPDASIGTCYAIDRATTRGSTLRDEVATKPLLAQVVGFDEEHAVLLPFADLTGVRPGASMLATEVGVRAPDAQSVLGDVIDASGHSLRDNRELPSDGNPLKAPPPSPLERRPIRVHVPTGIRVIDALMPFGEGQRIGMFAGSGVGKSTLLAQLTRGMDADVCIVALVGERGREVGEFLEEALTEETRKKTTIVVATSDAPPMMRMRAAELATALAEQWRDQGKHCLLLIDSLTRYARALREAALLAGEPPARRGYPASVFAALPQLLERTGQGSKGAISAVYTVLVEGGDMEEPVADEVRGIVDGHWVLRRSLAERGHYPAIDPLASVSRVATRIASPEHLAHATNVRRALAILERQRDAIDLGIYQYGAQAAVDNAIDAEPDLLSFLRQSSHELTPLDDTLARLEDLNDLVESDDV